MCFEATIAGVPKFKNRALRIVDAKTLAVFIVYKKIKTDFIGLKNLLYCFDMRYINTTIYSNNVEQHHIFSNYNVHLFYIHIHTYQRASTGL